jgi:hypothetical protein
LLGFPPRAFDLGQQKHDKPAAPFRWENVPWGLLLTLGVVVGVVVFVGAMAAGFYEARRPG